MNDNDIVYGLPFVWTPSLILAAGFTGDTDGKTRFTVEGNPYELAGYGDVNGARVGIAKALDGNYEAIYLPLPEVTVTASPGKSLKTANGDYANTSDNYYKWRAGTLFANNVNNAVLGTMAAGVAPVAVSAAPLTSVWNAWKPFVPDLLTGTEVGAGTDLAMKLGSGRTYGEWGQHYLSPLLQKYMSSSAANMISDFVGELANPGGIANYKNVATAINSAANAYSKIAPNIKHILNTAPGKFESAIGNLISKYNKNIGFGLYLDGISRRAAYDNSIYDFYNFNKSALGNGENKNARGLFVNNPKPKVYSMAPYQKSPTYDMSNPSEPSTYIETSPGSGVKISTGNHLNKLGQNTPYTLVDTYGFPQRMDQYWSALFYTPVPPSTPRVFNLKQRVFFNLKLATPNTRLYKTATYNNFYNLMNLYRKKSGKIYSMFAKSPHEEDSTFPMLYDYNDPFSMILARDKYVPQDVVYDYIKQNKRTGIKTFDDIPPDSAYDELSSFDRGIFMQLPNRILDSFDLTNKEKVDVWRAYDDLFTSANELDGANKFDETSKLIDDYLLDTKSHMSANQRNALLQWLLDSNSFNPKGTLPFKYLPFDYMRRDNFSDLAKKTRGLTRHGFFGDTAAYVKDAKDGSTLHHEIEHVYQYAVPYFDLQKKKLNDAYISDGFDRIGEGKVLEKGATNAEIRRKLEGELGFSPDVDGFVESTEKVNTQFNRIKETKYDNPNDDPIMKAYGIIKLPNGKYGYDKSQIVNGYHEIYAKNLINKLNDGQITWESFRKKLIKALSVPSVAGAIMLPSKNKK